VYSTPYFVIYADLGGSGPPSSFSLIPTLMQIHMALRLHGWSGQTRDLSHVDFLVSSLMRSPPDNVDEGNGSMFPGCPFAAFVRSFVRPFIRQILLQRYLMNGSSNLDENYKEYSLTPTDDLIRFRKSKVKVTAGRGGREGIHADAGVSKSVYLPTPAV